MDSQALTPEKEKLKQKIIEALKNCYDPEIPINIVDLGLVYDININENNEVFLRIGLTAPGCPVGYLLEEEVIQEVSKIPEVKSVQVEIARTPAWTPDRMSEEAKRQLGLL
ncbi:aromatic ring hydroxylase [Candidatus Marsarchaeota G2 archaeon ECH_B_SAG-F08]|jgi:metal-sulfur cluster biosynthetic enzyme|uniref:Aromatic ring hydroxylase n=5 Tax=Candidatus Marsarchaeota TaxID=1978152 RepID=A0A2R6C2P0_9ARCH|nr:MAG: aromatic ring hydroxylase [Candidatus Marsarchaeota G1 archaeon OSP_D]PSN85535.1 MAG: aromatic ring hydroxylase [Candidatus Marsarchaeota G1 archaeon BE_D]PSN87852.1 MAG: aromatic ring hydroxylase [Candidatus Marsarchaeota G1 archaeon OSP_C]PSN98240.1 MAG: aromatic ring hydroxylase [Candidatus Marsarchaeota G2 archaeon ECH_B_SAG-F08]PSO05026.1 MAG: aromatic ring hydroxylase [Candidatus Marsarchaeota G2 archaeon ECH_B_SAG-G06]